jgi:hypothetical protein
MRWCDQCDRRVTPRRPRAAPTRSARRGPRHDAHHDLAPPPSEAPNGGGRRDLRAAPGASYRPHHLPVRVFDPDEVKRVLKDGHQSRKIGKTAMKGPRRGWPIFTLTLEERATCPRTCAAWAFCYGNAMQAAERIVAGAELEQALWDELAGAAGRSSAPASWSACTSSATSTAPAMSISGAGRSPRSRRSMSSASPRAIATPIRSAARVRSGHGRLGPVRDPLLRRRRASSGPRALAMTTGGDRLPGADRQDGVLRHLRAVLVVQRSIGTLATTASMRPAGIRGRDAAAGKVDAALAPALLITQGSVAAAPEYAAGGRFPADPGRRGLAKFEIEAGIAARPAQRDRIVDLDRGVRVIT